MSDRQIPLSDHQTHEVVLMPDPSASAAWDDTVLYCKTCERYLPNEIVIYIKGVDP